MARNRALLTVLCVALVLLAGCSGVGGDGTATPDGNGTVAPNGTTTPAETGDNETEETAGLEELPPGVSEDGVSDTAALIDAHDAAIADRGAVVVTNVTVDSSTGTVQSNATTTFGADGTIDVERSQSFGASTFEVYQYTNGTISAVRQVTPSVERRSVFTAGGYVERQAGANGLRPYISAGEFSVVETGSDTVTLAADGVATDAGNGSGVGGNFTAYEATMVVDGDGRILSFEADATIATQGGETDIAVDYEIVDTDVETAQRPAWVDEALAEETIPRLSYERTDGAIAITNEGDEAIPRASVVSVASTAGFGTNQQTPQYAVQIEESIEPGETVYVYRAQEESIQGSVSAGEPPRGETAPIEGEVQVVIQGQGGVVDATTLSGDDDPDDSEE